MGIDFYIYHRYSPYHPTKKEYEKKEVEGIEAIRRIAIYNFNYISPRKNKMFTHEIGWDSF